MKKLLKFLLRWSPLIGIVLFAALIRFYKLGSLPFNLQEDEVMTGYVGRFILKNGRDVYGNPWPLWFFDKFGDFYIVLPIYLKGLSTFLFGVNEFAIRFPSALLGSLSVIPVFFISYWTFNKKKIGYFSALLLAIMPWHITLSRASAEGVMGIFFYSTGLMFIIGYVNRKKWTYALMSFIFFIICYWIYHPYRVVIPLTLLLFSVIMFFFKDKKTLKMALIGFLIFTLFTGYISTTKWGKGRFSQTSIFSPMSGVSIRIQELIYGEGQQKIFTARIFHNKILGYGREFLRQYSIYFSGEYLFVKGGLSYAYSVPEQGLLYFSFIIPLIAALIYLVKGNFSKDQKKSILFLLFLFFIVPIPASLTYIDAPNIQRSVDMVIFFSLFAGYGFYQLSIQKQWIKVLYLIAIIGFIMEGIYFWHGYTTHTDLYTSLYRNDGQKTLIEYIKKNKDKYDKIFLPTYGTMSMYYLYYMNDFDPNYIGKIKYDVRLDRSHNVYFVDSGCTSDKISLPELKQNILVVNKNNCSDTSGKFRQIDDIWGINKLLDFKILVPNKNYQPM